MAEFDTFEDLMTFSNLCKKYENVTIQLTDIVINNSEDEEDTNCCKYSELTRKISIHRYVKHIPIFSSRNPSTKEGFKQLIKTPHTKHDELRKHYIT